MGFIDKNKLPKSKSKEELDKHYDEMELEKGDMTAMLIAALITFGPIVLGISALYIFVAYLFGM